MAPSSQRFFLLSAFLVLIALSHGTTTVHAQDPLTTNPPPPVDAPIITPLPANSTTTTDGNQTTNATDAVPVAATSVVHAVTTPKQAGSKTLSGAVIGGIAAVCAGLLLIPLLFCLWCGCCTGTWLECLICCGKGNKPSMYDVENPGASRKLDVRDSDLHSQWSASTSRGGTSSQRVHHTESGHYSYASRSS